MRRGGALAAQVHVSEAQAAELQAHINRVLGREPAGNTKPVVDEQARRMASEQSGELFTLRACHVALTERVQKLEASVVRPAEMPAYVPYHPVQPVRRWWWQR